MGGRRWRVVLKCAGLVCLGYLAEASWKFPVEHTQCEQHMHKSNSKNWQTRRFCCRVKHTESDFLMNPKGLSITLSSPVLFFVHGVQLMDLHGESFVEWMWLNPLKRRYPGKSCGFGTVECELSVLYGIESASFHKVRACHIWIALRVLHWCRMGLRKPWTRVVRGPRTGRV